MSAMAATSAEVSTPGEVEFTPFEQLRITTITMIMGLSNGVNTEAAFHLLPITQVAIHQTRESSKCKLPHCAIPGSILSMRYRDNVRGVIRSKASPFKNAVTIDISTTRKNISLKLSSFSIQMCGASSREDGIEAATHVLNHLKFIQQTLNQIHQNPDQAQRTLEWVIENTRGSLTEKPGWEDQVYGTFTLRVSRATTDYTLVTPTVAVPLELNEDLARFYVGLSNDFLYHSDYCRKIQYIPSIQSIIDEPLEIDRIDEAMKNFNFNLGHEVDRFTLNQLMDGRNGMLSRWQQTLSAHTTVELPYEPQPSIVAKRRKGRVSKISFLIYKSGSVTMSGPGGEIMEQGYNLFMRTINEIREQIRYDPRRDYERVMAAQTPTRPQLASVVVTSTPNRAATPGV